LANQSPVTYWKKFNDSCINSDFRGKYYLFFKVLRTQFQRLKNNANVLKISGCDMVGWRRRRMKKMSRYKADRIEALKCYRTALEEEASFAWVHSQVRDSMTQL
jgi:hypothetical protein